MDVYEVRVNDLRFGRFYLRDSDVTRYASMSKDTAPPIKISYGRTVRDGNHRLASARARGDQVIKAVGHDIDPEIIVRVLPV
jgi:hypothetical protein